MVNYTIPDTILDKEEILEAMKTLWMGCALGASSMTIKNIKRWAAEWEGQPTLWTLVAGLVQHAFQTGVVPTWAWTNTLVLIPKPEPSQMHGIGLLEPM